MPRSPLIPKEHGAYGQLGLPLATALVMGRPTLEACLLVVAAMGAFFAHEPAAVLLGKRGVRRQRQEQAPARWSAALWIVVAATCAGAGLWTASNAVRWSTLVPLGAALAMGPVFFLGREKTLAGELGAAATLASASIPVARASGIQLTPALWTWAAWSLGFWCSTAAVRWVIARHKRRRARAELAAETAASALILGGALVNSLVLGAVPYAAAAWFLVARPPSPRHLKRVGWTLMGAGLLTAAVLVRIYHSP